MRPALEHSHYKNLDIQPQAPVFDVVTIVFDAAYHVTDTAGFAAKAIDLCPAGNAWLDAVT